MKRPLNRLVRVAVVGCGPQMLIVLLPCLVLHGVRITAACDLRPDRLDMVRNMYGVEACYQDLNALLSTESVDALVVAAGSSAHASIAREAVEAGVPVYLEKPPAATATEAQELVRLSCANRVPIMVGFNKRFAPVYRYMKTRGIGNTSQPLGASIRATSGPYPNFEAGILDFGIHFLDLARFLFGDIDTVLAWSTPRLNHHQAAVCAIQLKAVNGALIQIYLDQGDSWANPSEQVFLSGIEATFEGNNLTELIERSHRSYQPRGEADSDGRIWRPNFSWPSVLMNSFYLAGYLGALGKFLSVVRMGIPPDPSIVDGWIALRLVEAVVASCRRGTEVRIVDSDHFIPERKREMSGDSN